MPKLHERLGLDPQPPVVDAFELVVHAPKSPPDVKESTERYFNRWLQEVGLPIHELAT